MDLKSKILSLILSLCICYLTSFIGAVASIKAPVFYNELNKPSWSPPATVFGPVWGILYTLMAISLWLIYTRRPIKNSKTIYAVFLTQLVLNALWSWFFFSWKLGLFSFLEILTLLIFIAYTIHLFLEINKLAGILLIPYFLWVSFASVLTYHLWQLNPALLN